LTALQRQAFVVRNRSLLALPDLEPLRRYSVSSLFSNPVRSPTTKTKGGDSKPKAKKSAVPYTSVPITGKPRSRWQGMARQLLWNSKAAQMRLPEDLPKSELRIYISCTEG
jgi:hypothetical protein